MVATETSFFKKIILDFNSKSKKQKQQQQKSYFLIIYYLRKGIIDGEKNYYLF